MNDLRFAFRQLFKNPGFTFVGVLTLALAIGATTALFSLIKGAYLDALPYPRANDIVTLSARFAGQGELAFSGPEFVALQKETHTLQNVSSLMGASFNLTGEGDAVRFRGLRASASLFRMLEMQPLLGRVFNEEEQMPGRERVAIISYELWQRALAGAPNVIGRELRFNDLSYTIIGVMPPRFRYGDNDVWVPLSLDLAGQDATTRNVYIHARLAGGASLATANTELAGISRRINAELGRTDHDHFDWSLRAERLIDGVVRDVKSALNILLAAVACVLAIACANICNLQLARGVAREREMAVRLALGAQRGDLVKQLLVESGLIAIAGGVLGIFVAAWSLGPLLRLIPYSYVPIEAEVKIDGAVLVASALVTLITALLVGLVPALKASRPELNSSLKDARAAIGSNRSGRRMQSLLVSSQVALTFVVLIACALILKSFSRLVHSDRGFDATQLVKFEMALPAARYGDAAQVRQFYEILLRKIRNLPGVKSASAVTMLPLAEFPARVQIAIEGQPDRAAALMTEERQITPDYLATLGIPLVKGRDVNERDNSSAPPVALVNQTFAARYFPGSDPIGRRVRLGQSTDGQQWLKIVGITGDVRQLRMSDPVVPEIYLPHAQSANASRRMACVVRTEVGAAALSNAVRECVRTQDATAPVFNLEPVREVVERSFGGQKLAVLLLSAFGLLALTLTVIGIYGVTAYFAARRTSEIGIRIALGAQKKNILLLVLGHGFSMVSAGLILGLVGAFATTRLIRAMLFNVSSSDVVVYFFVSVCLAGAALLACLLPARRATRINPIQALRTE
ncbi:MAG: ABC transporter permease [Chthoniobacterales bacterium]